MEFSVANKESLIKLLVRERILRSPHLADALGVVDRREFVLPEHYSLAYEDVALPIGEGQTISQPRSVVFMLELLNPDKGDNVMDIGYGSGWQTALLAELVGEKGKVYAIELLQSLCKFGKDNVGKYSKYKDRVVFYCQNAAPGLPEVAEEVGGFDGIIIAAELMEVPTVWREQLKPGGRIVYPKRGSLYRETKHGNDLFYTQKFSGFAFVPFVSR